MLRVMGNNINGIYMGYEAKYLAWAKKHKKMTNNVPEFAHIDELETDDAEPATDGGSSSINMMEP